MFGFFDSFVMSPMVPAERPRKYSPLIFDNLYSRQFTSFTSEKHILQWSAMSEVYCKEINKRERESRFKHGSGSKILNIDQRKIRVRDSTGAMAPSEPIGHSKPLRYEEPGVEPVHLFS